MSINIPITVECLIVVAKVSGDRVNPLHGLCYQLILAFKFGASVDVFFLGWNTLHFVGLGENRLLTYYFHGHSFQTPR